MQINPKLFVGWYILTSTYTSVFLPLLPCINHSIKKIILINIPLSYLLTLYARISIRFKIFISIILLRFIILNYTVFLFFFFFYQKDILTKYYGYSFNIIVNQITELMYFDLVVMKMCRDGTKGRKNDDFSPYINLWKWKLLNKKKLPI